MFIILSLFNSVLCNKITNPPIQVFNETFPNNTFYRQVKEVLEIPYAAYPGVFAIDLHKRINGKIDSQSIDLGDFQKVEEDILEDYGCFAIQRDIEISMQLKLWLDKTGLTRDKYFTDVAFSVKENRAYIVRNDFVLFQVNLRQGLYEIDLETSRKSFESLLNTSDEDSHPYLVADIDFEKILIITNYGGVSFNSDKNMPDTEFHVEPAIQKRKRIFSVHYNQKNKILLVACGHEGADIYKIVDEQVTHLIHITTDDFGISNGQIIDINSNGLDTLYVLEKESGLRFYELHHDKEIKFLFLVEITNAKSFDYYDNTFFIVATTQNRQDYAAEVFVNPRTYDYFFNNFYIDEMTINDVNVFEYYAVLIGDDGHKIIYHSVYNGFINEDLVSHTSFQEPDLVKVIEYDFVDKNISNTRILGGIAKYEFKLIDIIMNMPMIQCKFDEVKTEQYYVQINSTNCQQKDDQVNLNYQFTLCNISHVFQFTTTQLPGNKTTYATYTIVFYILLVGLIWMAVLCYALIKRWGYKISFLSWRKKRVDASAPYNESFDTKEQEMVENQGQ